MTRSDLTDVRVLTIASEVHDDPSLGARSVVDVLADQGVPSHYTVAALNDLYRRGLVDCGPRMDFAWPTAAGRALLTADAPTEESAEESMKEATGVSAEVLTADVGEVSEHEQRRARRARNAALTASTASTLDLISPVSPASLAGGEVPVCGVGGCLTCPEAA